MTGVTEDSRQRSLRHGEKMDLALLALPTFALALAITVVTTQLGQVARRYTHDTILIGAIIGGEGFMALWVPLIFGSWSDVLRTTIGGRLPFVLAGGAPAAATVALIGFLHGLALIAVASALFFLFYFVAYEPYRAMYPDLLSSEISGRTQSAQAVARGLGTGLALLGGGLLLSVARPLPFAGAALVIVTALGAFVVLILRRGAPRQNQERGNGPRQAAGALWRLMARSRSLRAYFVANALWEMALAALKGFVFLYLVIGLHYPLAGASLIVGGVALVILVGSAAAGKLGDRFGRIRVARLALIAYGAGFVLLSCTTDRPAIAASIPFVALGGGAVMTLAYALLMPLMPDDEHGALTGFYSVSRGAGQVLGPVLAGLLVWLTGDNIYRDTNGFQAIWIVCAAASLLSLVFLRQLAEETEDDTGN